VTARDMTFVHLSDLHIQPEGKFYWGTQDGHTATMRVFDHLREYGVRPEFFVITGDLIQGREDDDHAAYRRFNAVMDQFRQEFGAPIYPALGNGDVTEVFRKVVLNEADPDPNQRYDYVTTVNGLRIVVLDSHDPQMHWGELTTAQLEWLAGELAAQPDMDHLLVLHHTPAPVVLGTDMRELRNADELEAVIRDYHFLGVLCGHVHMPFFSQFAGFPCIAAMGICNACLWSYAKNQLHLVTAPGYNIVHIRDRQLLTQCVVVPGDHNTVNWADGYPSWADES